MPERLSDKSPDAFRTISEVADHLDLPQHVLRFWETRFPEIKPVKRAGGRRFYRPEDVDLLRAIRHLLYAEGYTIKGVQKILKDQGGRAIQTMGADLAEGRETAAPAPSRAPAESSPGRGLLSGLLPRRRERKDDAAYLTDQSGLDRRPPPAFSEPEPAFDTFSVRPPRRESQREVQHAPLTARSGAAAQGEEFELPFDAFLPGFEAADVEPMAHRAPQIAVNPPPVRQAFSHDEMDDEHEEPRLLRRAPAAGRPAVPPEPPSAVLRADPILARPAAPHRPEPPPAVRTEPMMRPSRGPASRIPEPAPVPELEDPLLPFFAQDAEIESEDGISEPLDARIRRLKDHGGPAGAESAVPPDASGTDAPRRVGLLTGPFEDVFDDLDEEYPPAREGAPAGAYSPPEPRRHGPPEQYLPPHLRSDPRMSAAPAHTPKPVLSREDVQRLQATLYELGECRRLLRSALESEES